MFLEEAMEFTLGFQEWRVRQLGEVPSRTVPLEYLSKGAEVGQSGVCCGRTPTAVWGGEREAKWKIKLRRSSKIQK